MILFHTIHLLARCGAGTQQQAHALLIYMFVFSVRADDPREPLFLLPHPKPNNHQSTANTQHRTTFIQQPTNHQSINNQQTQVFSVFSMLASYAEVSDDRAGGQGSPSPPPPNHLLFLLLFRYPHHVHLLYRTQQYCPRARYSHSKTALPPFPKVFPFSVSLSFSRISSLRV